MLHRTRHLSDRDHQHHRAHLAEFGIVAPVGRSGVEELLYAVADQRDDRIPDVARAFRAGNKLGLLVEPSRYGRC